MGRKDKKDKTYLEKLYEYGNKNDILSGKNVDVNIFFVMVFTLST